MPGMDGLELLAEIKQRRPHTPVLLITGHGDQELAVQALRGGASDYVTKPIDRDYFVSSLDNAIKWSPPGGTVWDTLRDGTLQVDDEGPGIAEDDLPHVFERFYRSSEARGRPGSGLGLAIVRTAARRHGGHVSAGRAPTGGARLTMTLPGRGSSSTLV